MAKKNGTTSDSSMNICNSRATVDREEKKNIPIGASPMGLLKKW